MRDMPPVVLDGAHHDDATQESRACCALCNVKEFLIAITLFLILVDLFDVYGNLIRVTGTELLPFWGNHTDLYYTQVPELNFYDMIISVFDLCCVVVLSLSGACLPLRFRPQVSLAVRPLADARLRFCRYRSVRQLHGRPRLQPLRLRLCHAA